MAGAGFFDVEYTMRNVKHSSRRKFKLLEGQWLTIALRVFCAAGRRGGTVAERYQGGVAHRSAEAAASWWHLLSEDAVSEAGAAARRTAR